MTGIPRKAQLPFVAALLLWIPLAFLHPLGEPYAGISDEADRWLFVHVVQLVLTPALAELVVLRRRAPAPAPKPRAARDRKAAVASP